MADAGTLAQEITRALGGASNITEVENCMTRLRIPVRDEGLVDLERLRAAEGVIAVIPGPQYQIILGPGLVDQVADLMEAGPTAAPTMAQLAERGQTIKTASRDKHDSKIMRAARRLAAIFIPLIPALVATGLLAGVNGILKNLVTNGTLPQLASVTPFIGALSAGFLTLLPVFVGMNAAKEFGGTPILGGVTAAIIVTVPATPAAQLVVFGQHLTPGQGGVLGALAGGVLAALIERWARSWCPNVVTLLVVPALTILLSGLATVLILMSVTGWLAGVVGVAATWLLTQGGIAAGFILGGLFLPLVMTGMHQALTPIHAVLIEQHHYTVLLPVLAMAGAGQIGAALALWVRFRRNQALSRTIRGALPAGLLGIGEPLIYGVTLPLGRPFVTACIGGAFGGAVVGAFDQFGRTVGAVAIGTSDLSLFPLIDGSAGPGWAMLGYGSGLLAAYAAGFIATWFFGIPQSVIDAVGEETEELETVAGSTPHHATSAAPAPQPERV
ncbi:PTS transporter subunit EIIC [Paenarthrobacter sp. S56]|uniref:PTS transporter subunit EIIC n=1 Tax=Paenarthrobacter sp. S56 TaxID=3138179 RepID=UPI0032194212